MLKFSRIDISNLAMSQPDSSSIHLFPGRKSYFNLRHQCFDRENMPSGSVFKACSWGIAFVPRNSCFALCFPLCRPMCQLSNLIVKMCLQAVATDDFCWFVIDDAMLHGVPVLVFRHCYLHYKNKRFLIRRLPISLNWSKLELSSQF